MSGTGILKIILLIILAVCSRAKEYYISFDFVAKNAILTNEHFYCSLALTSSTSKSRYLFSLPLYKNIKSTCKKYENEIIQNLLRQRVVITSYEIKTEFLKTKTKLVFLPKRFDIIIKNDRVYFFIKEED